MQAPGSGISNCRLNPKRKERTLLCGEPPGGLFSIEFSKIDGACGQRVMGNISIAERGRKPLSSV